ncbi:MAG: PaaI family thioesterase [Gammaproteobacteria bacterium]|nr:PaaI family thioesterase [Gammaproteobacteria bacterium]
MSIWFGEPTTEFANSFHENTLVSNLGIEITEIGADSLVGRMQVDDRTRNPLNILHGGASLAFAETLGSFASNQCVDPDKYYCVGLDINANHIRTVTSGEVTGTARPLHLGRRTHVWRITINDVKNRLVCESRITVAVIKKDES